MKSVLVLCLSGALLIPARAANPAAPIVVDYPAEGSIFPPEFPAPTFIFRDTATEAAFWSVRVDFGDRTKPVELRIAGEPFSVGPIDPRAVSNTNELPKPTPEQAASRTWVPDDGLWLKIKQHSVGNPATVTITGYRDARYRQPVSSGRTAIWTSKDPVGAPIFYRDVPLMPSELKKGIIKPLAESAIPLIAWKLRSVGERNSRTLMEGVHTCANCHSFSNDGTTLGLDVDGPSNDKGMYALVKVQRNMSIRSEDVITWSTFRGKLGGRLRVGFMSSVSPDGKYVVTTINDPGPEDRRHIGDIINNYYVANFKDYRFLQVFYPTRGILAWYSKETGKLQPLPGADDPNLVQANAAWTPDGKYLVFSRAQAKDSYPPGTEMAQYANDPRETQIQYSLYRIPFNGGKGGKAEPIAGASDNGMSNSFPKVSPDGKWIVFVKCKNGQLMRPDSELWIVPAEGGTARRMKCNTPRMNSWHSFSPNGRWLVFSSKGRSPYTQMYLTHIDENGNDSPPVLIENATAANRAVNIPEFVNVEPGGIEKIDTPAMAYYQAFNVAAELLLKHDVKGAIRGFERAANLSPDDPRVHTRLGDALTDDGRTEEGLAQYRKALELDPDFPDAHTSLGTVLAARGEVDAAIDHFEKALRVNPEDVKARTNLGGALIEKSRLEEGIEQCRAALKLKPDDPDANNNLAIALARTGQLDEAIPHFEAALAGKPDSAPILYNLARVLAARGRWAEAIPHLEKAAQGGDPNMAAMLAASYSQAGRLNDALTAARRALDLARAQNRTDMVQAISARIAALEAQLGEGR